MFKSFSDYFLAKDIYRQINNPYKRKKYCWLSTIHPVKSAITINNFMVGSLIFHHTKNLISNNLYFINSFCNLNRKNEYTFQEPFEKDKEYIVGDIYYDKTLLARKIIKNGLIIIYIYPYDWKENFINIKITKVVKCFKTFCDTHKIVWFNIIEGDDLCLK